MTQKMLAGAVGLLALAGFALAQAPAPAAPTPTDQPAATAPDGGAALQGLTLGQAAAGPAIQPSGGGELQRITVTGYIIPRLGEGTQPVFNIDRDWWQRRGQQNTASVLETLPFANGNFNQTFSPGNNTSPAGDAVNLRNVGVNATLVLVDGLRFPLFPLPLNFTQTFVDLNSIPIAAIDRIEILKDNGTATYGDDAVAGVINIILRDTYNGAQFNNYVGFRERTT
jgi:iron complex outermembrane recepter protein